MELKGKKIGFALCGSFCTLNKVIAELEKLSESGADIYPIMSEILYNTDTRFGKAENIKKAVKNICGHEIISSIKDAEPIGPKELFDILIVAPCTGNTIAKIAAGIADSTVTLAVKAHLRNQRPLVIAVSTNDGLAAAAKNIGALLDRKNVFLVPMRQDDCVNKPMSLVADMTKTEEALKMALEGKQLQPVLC